MYNTMQDEEEEDDDLDDLSDLESDSDFKEITDESDNDNDK